MQQFVPVLTAVVAAAAALVGAFGGPWLKARTDQQQWRREQRLDAYADLYGTMIELILAIEDERQGRGKPNGFERTFDAFVRADSRVRIVSGKSVQAVVYEAAPKVITMIAKAEALSDDEIDEVRRLNESIAEAARKELGFNSRSLPLAVSRQLLDVAMTA